MAKFNIGILGGVSGKVGTVVGYKMNGVDYLRAKIAHMKNPKTTGQLAVRSKMRAAVKLATGLLKTLIHPVWKRSGKLSSYNRFVQANIQAFGPDGLVSDPSKLVFSKGTLLAPEGLTAATVTGTAGKVGLTWTPDVEDGKASGDDVLKVVTLVNGVAAVLDDVAETRSAGTASIVLPFASGTKVNLFAFFVDKDGKKCSNDVMAQVTMG